MSDTTDLTTIGSDQGWPSKRRKKGAQAAADAKAAEALADKFDKTNKLLEEPSTGAHSEQGTQGMTEEQLGAPQQGPRRYDPFSWIGRGFGVF